MCRCAFGHNVCTRLNVDVFGFTLHLREGSEVLGVEVVERLVDLPLLHVTESLTSCLHEEQLLGSLQLDSAHTLLDLPQASSCREFKPLGQPDPAQSLHGGTVTKNTQPCSLRGLCFTCVQTQNLTHAANAKKKKTE